MYGGPRRVPPRLTHSTLCSADPLATGLSQTPCCCQIEWRIIAADRAVCRQDSWCAIRDSSAGNAVGYCAMGPASPSCPECQRTNIGQYLYEHGSIVWLVCRHCAHIWMVEPAAPEIPSGREGRRKRSDQRASIPQTSATHKPSAVTPHVSVGGGHTAAAARQTLRGGSAVVAPKTRAIRLETSESEE
jgi:hypothetical protein